MPSLEENRHKRSAGPHGVGDPDDKSLRRVEIDVMIPKKMRDKAKAEKCAAEVQKFTECCSKYNVLMVVKCRVQNTALKQCLTRWYEDEDFRNVCKKEYLEERSQFRRTGIRQKETQRYPSNM